MKIGNEITTSEPTRINQGRSSSATGGAAFADILGPGRGRTAGWRNFRQRLQAHRGLFGQPRRR